jgi:predicted MFS family arabinose efflux permease
VSESTTFRWDRLTVTCALSFCLLVSGLSVGVVLGELRDELELSGVVAAAHGSTFGAGLLVMGLFGLRIVTRVGRPAAFWGTCVMILAGVAVLCAGHSWPLTLGGTAIAGLACAMLVLLMPGIVADHHGPARVGAFAAINGVPGLAGVSYSLAVGAAIGAGMSWRWPYLALTLFIAAVLAAVGAKATIPTSSVPRASAVQLLRHHTARRPFLDAVHAVLAEFPLGVWAVTFLKEVGGSSSGGAAALGAVWGLCIMVARLLLPRYVAVTGVWARSIGFAAVTLGSLVLWMGPGLGVRIVGLVLVAFGCSPLYPLAVDRLYARVQADSVTLGAVTALASGVAIVSGPLLLGVLADAIGLRDAVLAVTALAALGIYTSRPDADAAPVGDEPLSVASPR